MVYSVAAYRRALATLNYGLSYFAVFDYIKSFCYTWKTFLIHLATNIIVSMQIVVLTSHIQQNLKTIQIKEAFVNVHIAQKKTKNKKTNNLFQSRFEHILAMDAIGNSIKYFSNGTSVFPNWVRFPLQRKNKVNV